MPKDTTKSSLYHPYQRSSTRPPPLSSGDTNAASRFADSQATSFFPKPRRFASSAVRPSFASSVGPTEDINGEFNLFLTRKELLKSVSGKERLRQSIGSNDSSPLFRSTNSSGTNASLDLYSDPELIKARKEIRDLKESRRKISDEKAGLERKVHDLEKSAAEKEDRIKERMARIDILEADREFLLKHVTEVEQRLEDAEKNMIKWKKDAEMTENTLKRQNGQLREQLAQEREQADSELRHGDLEKEQMEADLERLYQQVAENQNEFKKHSAQAKANREQQGVLERQLREAQATIMNLQANDALTELITLKRGLIEQTTHLRTMEKKMRDLEVQNSNLLSTQQNTELLKDENEHLAAQVARLAESRDAADKLAVEIEQLKAEKQEWARFLSENDDVVGVDSPHALAQALANARLELAALKEASGEDRASAKWRAAELERLREQLKEREARIADAERRRELEARACKRLEHSRQLAQKEIEFLREQLRSYDIEDASNAADSTAVAHDALKADRIRVLEGAVDEYRAALRALEDQLAYIEKNKNGGIQAAPAHQEPPQDPQLPALLAAARAECESLHSRVHELERALGRGEHNPATHRVLQLAKNPETMELAVRQATLDALQAENAQLRAQCANAPTPATSGGGDRAVPVESLRVVELECSKLKQEIQDTKKRNDRLQQVYQTQVQEYREAVYSLLGYKLVIESDGRVRLTSCFADDPRYRYQPGGGTGTSVPAVVFDSAGGTVTLAGGSGGQVEAAVRNALRQYLDARGCAAAFLAKVTLVLFEGGGGSS
ncbi:coiled-coil domain-containing protein mad1 [Geranomyces variabilis]|uniref:Spindle assembly checkpoint component MAD1 n=1 Tax=Geranomyces variabilis TaxID=109894 RepID=A0AAD5TM53_9FUNG|nr:coiled-coil domain-containing protein mad1 [Geranomyces variabilis]